jgi:PEGA domain-containing protein
MNQRLLITLGILMFLIGGTFVAIRWAQGYRFDLKQQAIAGNGLLVANSLPKGASVYINDELETATDDTLHLNPGKYNIRLEKDGYFNWQKDLLVEKELVTQINAQLFPNVPDLSALTLNGASNPTPSPDGHKIAFKIATGSAEAKYGLWILNVNENPLRFGSNAIQLAQDIVGLEFSQAQIFWNPNSNEILAYFNENQAYLLNVNSKNKPQNLINVALQLPIILQDWQKQLALERERRLIKLPLAMQEIATKSATLLYFSPNEEKLLYAATASAIIEENLIPPLPAVNSQPQQRQISPGSIYVYDLKEDTNYLIDDAFDQIELQYIANFFTPPFFEKEELTSTTSLTSQTIRQPIDPLVPILSELKNLQAQYSPLYSPLKYQWFPNSYHLITVDQPGIGILEYDGTNKVFVFSGLFQEQFAYPWPNGQQLILLTSLTTNPKMLSNLYALNLE